MLMIEQKVLRVLDLLSQGEDAMQENIPADVKSACRIWCEFVKDMNWMCVHLIGHMYLFFFFSYVGMAEPLHC